MFVFSMSMVHPLQEVSYLRGFLLLMQYKNVRSEYTGSDFCCSDDTDEKIFTSSSTLTVLK